VRLRKKKIRRKKRKIENKKAQEAEKKAPISKMEERKWQMLNKKGVNTLMIPLPNKGEKRNETNPW